MRRNQPLRHYIRLPRAFYDDHAERALPTPEAVRQTTRFVWLRQNAPFLDELIADARFYAGADGPDAAPRYVREGAARLLRAVARFRAKHP